MNEKTTNEDRCASEEKYWRERHAQQPYASGEHAFEEYAPAYRAGVTAFGKYPGRTFEDVEQDVAQDYEKSRRGVGLPWDHARHAVRAAWAKLSNDVTGLDRDRGIRTGF
jgi:hypothetical protein